MTKGLLVDIYYPSYGDCSNGGLSSRCDKAVLTGDGVPEIFEPCDRAPELLLFTGNLGDGYRAVPAEGGRGTGPMFGGCFVYTSDSRFPGNAPIALHDRWEQE